VTGAGGLSSGRSVTWPGRGAGVLAGVSGVGRSMTEVGDLAGGLGAERIAALLGGGVL
jgi:hypothetical protein